MSKPAYHVSSHPRAIELRARAATLVTGDEARIPGQELNGLADLIDDLHQADEVRQQKREREQAEYAKIEAEREMGSQDVIDAIHIALMAQKDPAEALRIVDTLVEHAPETDGSRGVDLLLRLISDAALKVSVAS